MYQYAPVSTQESVAVEHFDDVFEHAPHQRHAGGWIPRARRKPALVFAVVMIVLGLVQVHHVGTERKHLTQVQRRQRQEHEARERLRRSDALSLNRLVHVVPLTGQEVLNACDANNHTAAVCSDGAVRNFVSEWCEIQYTLTGMHAVFVAHTLEWGLMGRDDPWWSVLIEMPKGKGIDERSKRAFYESGTAHVNMVTSTITSRRTSTGGKHRALDFGCGLGRLAFNLARVYDEVACVDQSVFHLHQAAKEWERWKRPTDGTVAFLTSSPDLLAAVDGQRYDLVHSIIVLQHMVAPLQQMYMEQMCDVLKPDGYGWVHVPLMIPNWVHSAELYVNKTRKWSCDLPFSMQVGGMQMHFTPPKYIMQFMQRRGCEARVYELQGDGFIGEGMVGGIVLFRRQESTAREEWAAYIAKNLALNANSHEEWATYIAKNLSPDSNGFFLRAADSQENVYPAAYATAPWDSCPDSEFPGLQCPPSVSENPT